MRLYETIENGVACYRSTSCLWKGERREIQSPSDEPNSPTEGSPYGHRSVDVTLLKTNKHLIFLVSAPGLEPGTP